MSQKFTTPSHNVTIRQSITSPWVHIEKWACHLEKWEEGIWSGCRMWRQPPHLPNL